MDINNDISALALRIQLSMGGAMSIFRLVIFSSLLARERVECQQLFGYWQEDQGWEPEIQSHDDQLLRKREL